MKKLKTPHLVTVTIFTTITVVFWIFYSVYLVLTTKPSTDVPAIILEPIDPSLDTASLEQIEKRIFFEEGEVPIQILTPTLPPPAPESI